MTTQQKSRWYGPKQLGMIIFTGILMLVSACFVGGATNTVLPAIAEAHGWNAQFLNIWSGIACIIDGVGILVWARLARKNAKLLAAIALFATGGLMCIFGFTDNLVVLIIVMLLLGFASSAYCSTCAFVLTANWWPTKKGIVLGWSTMGIVLMSVVYAPYIPSAYAAFGIGWTNVGLGAIAVIIGIISLIFIKDTPEAAGTTPDGLVGVDLEKAKNITAELAAYKSPYTLKKMISSPNNWIVSLSVGIPLMVAMTYIATTIPALLSFGYSYMQAAAVFSVGGIVALFGSWALGMVDQKIGTKKALIIMLILMLIAVISCLFMDKNFTFAWISGVVLFCASGASRNLSPSYVATIYGRWDYPAAYQMIGTIAGLFCGAGVMITGFFPTYQSMYIFDIGATILAIILTIISKDKFIGKSDASEMTNKAK